METTRSVFVAAVNKDYPVIHKGRGAVLWDTEGREYIDCAAGVAVANIGHGVMDVVEAIYEQGKRVSYVYGGTFTSEARELLATQLLALAPANMERVFFCSGGSEAMESVVKIARQYHLESGRPQKYKVISRWQSYHGNTLATLSMGGRPCWRAKYEPLLSHMPHISPCNCYYCPYGLEASSCACECAEELERVIRCEGPETVSAFVMEPIVGTTAPAVAPPAAYMRRVREICDAYDVLLCVDEVITGLGRTGKNFAVDHYDLKPDLIALAKGLGGGYVPIGAVIVSGEVAEAFARGTGNLMHSFTYAGNPMACAGASAALTYLTANNLIAACATKGDFLLSLLREKLGDHPHIGEIRGKGLLLGLEYVQDRATRTPYPAEQRIGARMAEYCFAQGLLVVFGVPGTADGILGDATQISPPFVIGETEMRRAVDILTEAAQSVL